MNLCRQCANRYQGRNHYIYGKNTAAISSSGTVDGVISGDTVLLRLTGSCFRSPLKTPSGVFRHNFRRTASSLLVRLKALLRRLSLSDKNSARNPFKTGY
ncbi:MAG: hypothetical protein PHH84_00455 [Oscillospiraceae bacterium]|nr:hypothetical protein [Oscillospiraceae bacterium]MDD4413084.1 hypothetical protein [Oscillospiraceae bacterium]